MSNQIVISGRLVMGHPMQSKIKTDDRTGQPKLTATGEKMSETFVAVAVPKNGSTDWKTTDWGAQIVAKAREDWPRGEHGAPSFAWKVEDGDSAVPNKRGIANNSREGFPGHWIVKASTLFSIGCFHVGKYAAEDRIMDVNAIKCGDYCRLAISTKGNGSKDSPGMYVNPELFELSRPGEAIVVAGGPDAAEVFGGQPASAAPPAPVAAPPAPVAAPPAPVAAPPAPDFLQPPAPAPEPSYNVNGTVCTKAQLVAAGWTEEQIATLPTA